MAGADVSIRLLFDIASKGPGKVGNGKISSPAFVGLCRDLNVGAPSGCVDVAVLQSAHQKYRAPGDKTLDFTPFCLALTDVLMVARAYHEDLSKDESNEGQRTTAQESLGYLDSLLDAIKKERETNGGKASMPAYVPVYKEWMSNKGHQGPSPKGTTLPSIFDSKSPTAKGGKPLQVPGGYQADENSPTMTLRSKRSAKSMPTRNSAADCSPGDSVLNRMVERISYLEEERYDAMGGPAHMHATSPEEIARKLQYLEMRLVKAEGQLAQRQSRITEVETRCSEADARFHVQEKIITRLQQQVDDAEISRIKLEASNNGLQKQLDVMKAQTSRQESSMMSLIRAVEKRLMTVEVKCIPPMVSKDSSAKGRAAEAPNLLLSSIHQASQEAIEAKLVASKARDAAAKVDKTVAYLATKVEKMNTGEGSALDQRVLSLEKMMAVVAPPPSEKPVAAEAEGKEGAGSASENVGAGAGSRSEAVGVQPSNVAAAAIGASPSQGGRDAADGERTPQRGGDAAYADATGDVAALEALVWAGEPTSEAPADSLVGEGAPEVSAEVMPTADAAEKPEEAATPAVEDPAEAAAAAPAPVDPVEELVEAAVARRKAEAEAARAAEAAAEQPSEEASEGGAAPVTGGAEGAAPESQVVAGDAAVPSEEAVAGDEAIPAEQAAAGDVASSAEQAAAEDTGSPSRQEAAWDVATPAERAAATDAAEEGGDLERTSDKKADS